jgi:hypothetical protein
LRSLAKSFFLEHYRKHQKFLSGEKLSQEISKQIFNENKEKYKIDLEKKLNKQKPPLELSKELKSEKNWPSFKFYPRPLPTRTANEIIKEIKDTFPENIQQKHVAA